MATTIGHEKPEGVEEPPAVKKVRLDEDARVEAKVAEDVKKVKIDEGSTSEAEAVKAAQVDGAENADANGGAGEEEAAPTAASDAEEKEATTPNVAGSAFGGFAAFSGSGGFGSFSVSAPASGFGAFASSSNSSSGFGTSSTSGGFGTTFSASASTSASTSPVPSTSAAEGKSDEESSKEADKTSGFSGFAGFQNTSTFSSVASATTATDGFGTSAESSDLSEIDAAAAAEKKPEALVPHLTEAELANGEEDETILVEKRAKLYKLVDGDYAEVGIGPLRVLRAKDADPADKAAARFVMRRESYARGPGTKLLVNAGLASCLACVRKTEKALVVTVLEPAEEQDKDFSPATYLLRFGAPEDLDAVHARLARYLPAAK